MARSTWVLEILAVLKGLDGKATLQEIYNAVEQRGQLDLSKYQNWKSVVRKTIYLHSSDCEIFRGTKGDNTDLFYSVEGIGEGMWGIRENL